MQTSKSFPLFNLVLSGACLGAAWSGISLPAQAGQTVTMQSHSESHSEFRTESQTGKLATDSAPIGQTQTGATIPQTAGIVISLPGNLTVDVGQKQDYPLTVPLAQPLFDTAGNEVVPANSPVVIKLKPEQGGARIVAEAIVVRGQIVAVQAATAVIPGNTITQTEGADVARQNSAVYGNLFGSILGAAAPTAHKADAFDQGGMIGGALGILSGMGAPKSLRVVQLPQGSVYVLTLQAPVVLPTFARPTAGNQTSENQAAANQPANGEQVAVAPAQFDFKTVLDYSKGLEAVMAAYQNGQISQDEARRVIVAANDYATTVLSPKLYPPAGVRNRVAQMFGFRYAIDL